MASDGVRASRSPVVVAMYPYPAMAHDIAGYGAATARSASASASGTASAADGERVGVRASATA